ncbi:MAG: SDR family NAD(P)-dependent oxidoreductase [Methyloceanibacter sp.]
MNGLNKKTEPSDPGVVITGATHGVGRALADEFARAGHVLLLVARDEASLTKAAEELSSNYDVEVKVLAADLSTEGGCAAVEQALQSSGLYADMLVNNAGMMMAGFFQDQDPAKLRKLIDLDVGAVVDLTRRLLPGMIARRGGGVLNVASVEGFMPVPYQATYAAAKAFILSFTRALAYETMGTGVRVSALAPGTVATEMHAKAGAEYSRYVQYLPAMSAEDVARIGYRKFVRGRKVIVPGWFNRFSTLVAPFVPKLLLVPFMGLLFRVLDAEGNPQWPRALPRPELAKKGASPKAVVEDARRTVP